MALRAEAADEAEPVPPPSLVIDLSGVRTPEGLQRLLQRELWFPDFYGRNWGAFWDAITGLVELPEELVLTGWPTFSAVLPGEARMLRERLDAYLAEYGSRRPVPGRIHYR
ncbi:barstar family protein [Streptomyces sp. F41]|uniref:barstar family protein n=1 Tax=Streptomyces sp. F41 TaxID=1795888 RepID=UPI0030D38AC7